MSLGHKLGTAVAVLLLISIVCWLASDRFRALVFFSLRGAYFVVHPVPSLCKQRAADFHAKVEVLRGAAKNSLKIGTKKDDVIHFFAAQNIPLTIDQIGSEHEATGTISFKGLAECQNVACGDDSALIGVHVKLDIEGTVVSDPVVTGMYTDCL